MRVFVTGATGFIGSAVVPELISAGHQVLGLARSDASAKRLSDAGAQVQHGSLDDLEILQRAAADCDAIIHLAFIHDFSNYAASVQADRLAIEALGAALVGSDRPIVVTSGTLMVSPGRVATEDQAANPNSPRASEVAAAALASRGVNASVVRLPPTVHGDGDHGFVATLIKIAREKGVSAYINEGTNRWPAVHRLDAANLFRLAVEKSFAGARFHAVADEGVPTREIAEVIGRHLDVPVVSKTSDEAAEHFGWIGPLFAIDNPSSSLKTQEELRWYPSRPGLIADLESGQYFQAVTA